MIDPHRHASGRLLHLLCASEKPRFLPREVIASIAGAQSREHAGGGIRIVSPPPYDWSSDDEA